MKSASAQSSTPNPIRTWLSVVVGLCFGALYGWHAAPGIVAFFDDSLEFQVVLPTFGIGHPTGYPLYTIVGGLWSRLLPLGEWAGRVNLFSALCAGVEMGFLCQSALLLAAGRTDAGRARIALLPAWSAIGATLAFGLSPTWWLNSTMAEVYALHMLFVALILWLTLRVGNAAPAQRAAAIRWLMLAVGLGLAHHRTTLLLLPAVAVWLVWGAPELLRPQRAWLGWLAAALGPLLLYLWLPLRSAMGVADLNGAYVNNWAGFWDHVLARAYGAFFGPTVLAVERGAGDWLALSVRELGWAALLLALAGLAIGLSRQGERRGWVLVLLAGVANLIFALLYRVGDVEVFLLPVWLTLALAAGRGVAAVVAALFRRPPAALLAGAALLGLLLPLAPLRTPLESRRDDWEQQDLAIALTSGSFPSGSRVLGIEGEVTAIRYMQLATGRASTLTPVAADDPLRRRVLLEEALGKGTPVYLTRELQGIEDLYSFGGEGALVRVWPRGQAQTPPPSHVLDLPMAGGSLVLEGYDLVLLPGAHRPTAELALYWQPQIPLTQTLKLSLRVVDVDGNTLSLADGTPAQQDLYPLRLVAPTLTWLPGETVRDVYQIPLAPERMGAQILLILYDAETVSEAGRWQVAAP